VLDPDNYYIVTLAPSGIIGRADQLTITGRPTPEERRFHPGQNTVRLSCWTAHAETDRSLLCLRLYSKKRPSDGPGRRSEYAWEFDLTNARPNPPNSDRGLTALFYVDEEGSVHEPGPNHISRLELNIDGEGRPRPPTASAPTTTPNRLPH
jgi:hypothetical protein